MQLLTVEQAFSPAVATETAGWFGTWKLSATGEAVRVRFSARLSRAIGRCYPARRVVSLASVVREFEPSQVLDVLCHEFAHIAAYERFGLRIRPHGPEWQALVRQVGHNPRVCFDDADAVARFRRSQPRRRRFLHSCPNCGASRVAARRMPRWRCGPCFEVGRSGRLLISMLVAVEAGA